MLFGWKFFGTIADLSLVIRLNLLAPSNQILISCHSVGSFPAKSLI
jgi:hypothetical protein